MRTYATADGTVLGPEISTSDDLGELIWVDEANGLVAATTQPPARMIALDLAAGAEVAPPFESTTATSAGYSAALDRYVTSGIHGIEIRRRAGVGPLERVIDLPPAQQEALANGGSIYASVAPEGRLIAAVFELQLQPETVVFDLAAEPPTWERFEFQGLPTGAGPYLLMTYWDSMVVLDAGLRPAGRAGRHAAGHPHVPAQPGRPLLRRVPRQRGPQPVPQRRRARRRATDPRRRAKRRARVRQFLRRRLAPRRVRRR